MQTAIKTRFSPSPTGLMHLGNTRTALFSALYGWSQKGTFLLRIEDTDKARSKDEFVVSLQEDLQWLNLNWQEGPFYQSERQGIYDNYYQILIDKKLAYPCFCSEQQLSIMRKVQLSSGQPPRYPGTCRNLTEAQVQEKIAQGLAPALRFHVTDHEEIVFNDLVKGLQKFNSTDIGDFIIRRMDGTSPFMYCNAIDDALMGVTCVLRGEDHLTNTPRQVMILQALGLPVPQYAHISLIVGDDGSPLSKRHGSKSVNELRSEGYLPAAINNYLARLGHSYESSALMDIKELAQNFDIHKLSKSPARFDKIQLIHWQKEAVMQLPLDQLWQWMGIEVHSLVPVEQQALFIDTIRPNIEFPKDAEFWAQRLFDDKLNYSEENQVLLKQTGSQFFKIWLEALDELGTNCQAICETLKNKANVKGKQLYQPLRIALTDELQGPHLDQLMTLIGIELIARRLQSIIKLIG